MNQSMTIEKNKQIAKKYLLELYGKWNIDLVDELIHDEYVLSDNSVVLSSQYSTEKGKAAFLKRLIEFSKSLPDLKYGIIKIIAEEDSVIVWWALKATQVGEVFGFPSKGKTVQIFGTNHFIMEDGKIRSNTINFDTFSFLIQLGHVTINTDQEEMVMQYLKHLANLRL